MNVTEHYRSTLDELTFDRPGGPDLDAVIAGGRRRRRVRRTAVVGAGVAALAVASVTGAGLLRQHDRSAVDPGFATGPSYQDFVANSDIDEAMQATVAQHLSGLSAADKVYASDWNHLGPGPDPIPDDQAANATEWNARYSPSGNDAVLVQMSKAVPGWPTDPQCSEIVPSDGAPACSVTKLPGGGQVARYGTYGPEVPQLLHPYSFMTLRTNADGSFIMVREQVAADSWTQAATRRSITDEEASALVDDPALTFPDPVVTPLSPAGP